MFRAAKLLVIATVSIAGFAGRSDAQYGGLTQWTGLGANGHWYAITEAADDFRVLQVFAESLGGTLVSITSAAENQFVYSNFVSLGTCAPVWCSPATFYIGFVRASQGGPFEWLTGEPVTFTSWNEGEPNNSGDERVTHMFSKDGGQTALWNDISYTSNPMRAVIEWEQNPTVVPEPATFVLVASGMLALGIQRRVRGRRR